MSVLINKQTKVICQGFTGKARYISFSNNQLHMALNFVGGVTPGKGGQTTPR